MNFLIRLVVNAAALYAAAQIVDGVHFAGDWPTLFGVALVFTVVNAIVKPITKFFTFPLIILTLGLFLFVINGLMLLVTSRVAALFGLGFTVRGFWPAVFAAIVVSVVNAIAHFAIGGDEKRSRRG